MKENIVEEKIDFINLFKIIWNSKKSILIFSFCCIVIAFVYLYFKTPIFEVKSVIKIGQINDKLLEDKDVLIQKIKLIYDVDNPNNIINENNPIVSRVNSIKNLDNFIEVYTRGYSNEKAIAMNKKIISYMKSEYEYKLNSYKLKIETNIKNIKNQIENINNIEKKSNIRNIEKLKKQDLLKVSNQIHFKKNIEIKVIEKKLDFKNKKLNEYEETIKKLSNMNNSDNTQSILKSIQLSNIQNIVLSIQNDIQNLEKERNRILNISIKNLLIEKENIIKDKLKKLENNLHILIPNKINGLKDKITFENEKLKNIENNKLVGSFFIRNEPIEPKKNIILLFTFLISMKLAIAFILTKKLLFN